MKRAPGSLVWGFYCASSWTWCIGMFLPFILLRLWGWPGFWAFFIPNVLGCALFGFVLDAERSRALVARLGRWMALFSAVTVAYQCFFAGWAAHAFFVPEGAMSTVAATGVPIALLAVAAMLCVRSDGFLAWTGAVALLATLLLAVVLAPSLSGGEPRPPDAPLGTLAWAVPTISFGFLLCPYLDLTFHRALQRAPRPRMAFAAFGVSFGFMLTAMASLYQWRWGLPLVDWVIAAVWAIQLTFTVAVHLRELALLHPSARLPTHMTAAMVCGAILLATPAMTMAIGPRLATGQPPLTTGVDCALLPGEGVYLAFLGAYGLLFPAVVLFLARGCSARTMWGVVALGVPCYLLGAWEFFTYLMPVPVALALVLGWRARVHSHT